MTTHVKTLSKKNLSQRILSSVIMGLAVCCGNVAAQSVSIDLPTPSWQFDANTQPLQEREAGLDPNERELAATLRPLIDSQQYQQAAAVLEQADQSTFSAAMHFVRAQIYMSMNDMAGAEAAYQDTLAKMPDFVRAHRGLGIVYLNQQRLRDAREHITRAIELGANDAQLYGQLSYLNLQTGSPWSAISGYQQAMFLDADNPQWRQGLLYALMAAKDFAGASALLEELLQQDPDDPDLWLQRSNIALNSQDDAMALSSLEMAIRLGNNTPANLLAAGQLHLRAGSLTRGVDLLEDTLDQETDTYRELVNTVDWLVQREQLDLAKRLTSRIREQFDRLDSTEQSALLTQEARLNHADGNADRAISQLDQAISINPANGNALLELAMLHSQAQNYANAASLYTRAQALSDYRERALLSHAQLAVDMRDYEQAISLLELARRDNPRRRDLTDNITTLSRIISLQQPN